MNRNTIPLIGGLHVGSSEPIDDRLLGDSIEEYLLRVPKQLRYIGLNPVIVINGVSTKYWFKEGIEDEDLVLDITDIDNPAFVPKTITSLDDSIAITEFYQTTDLSATPRYTNLTPTPQQVHGIAKDSVFDKVLITKVLDDLLHPYVNPTIYGFYIDGQQAVVEIGLPLSGTKTFMWSKSTAENIKVDSGTITNLTDGIILKENINAASLSRTSIFINIDNSEPFIKSFNIKALDIYNQTITSNTFTMQSIFPMFIGSVADLNPTDQNVLLMERVPLPKSTVSRPLTFTWKRPCFAYPAIYGTLNSIKDISGFENLSGSIKSEINIDINGVSCLYYVYTTAIPSTVTNYTMTYSF